MENVNRWYFTKEELASTPSRKSGIDANKELSYRQQAANFIQDMGQRLQVSQLCINTAIVYMHRFYVFHSFSEVHRNNLSVAALFLAAKVEEQPRKLEHVIKVAHVCLHKDTPPLDVRTEAYAEKQFEVVAHENVLLQTLGFVLAIEHPHTYVVKVCQLVKASKDLAQTSYFMATTSLHMTTMCLQYRPTVVACVCIHLACKWSSWKIEPCSEGKEWYYYVDKTVTLDLLETLTQEFVAILETSPHRFKRRFTTQKDPIVSGEKNAVEVSSKHHSFENKSSSVKKEASPGPSTSTASFLCSQSEEKPVSQVKVENIEKLSVPPSQAIQSSPKKNKVAAHSISIDVYREKKEKERQEQKSVPSTFDSAHLQQLVVSKTSNDHERPYIEKSMKNALSPWAQTSMLDFDMPQKNVTNFVEQHIAKALIDQRSQKTSLNTLEPHVKEKPSKANVNKEHQVHSTLVNKINHNFPKTKLDGSHSKESRGSLLKIPSGDPVVVLERVDVKHEVQDISGSEVSSIAQHPMLEKVVNVQDHKNLTQGESLGDSKESLLAPMAVTSTPAVLKSKHPKHKINSLHNSQNIAQPLPHKLSPIKDLKTNGSKETDPNERRNVIVENNVGSVKSESNKSERKERHKSKHSSKDKSIINHSEYANPAIKVKIRKDIINLPEKNPKPPLLVMPENPKKAIKIKLPKPPVTEPAKGTTPTSIKLVITKDKSGSGSYSTSHKNDRESKKRSYSPVSQDFNYKNFGETPSKHAKYDHAHSSHVSMKQSKNRHSSNRNMDHSSNDVSSGKHLGNDSTGYLKVDVETYTSQPYYGNQYFPYQIQTPPPPPPSHGLRIKTNSNPPLPPPLPPQPPPPPE